MRKLGTRESGGPVLGLGFLACVVFWIACGGEGAIRTAPEPTAPQIEETEATPPKIGVPLLGASEASQQVRAFTGSDGARSTSDGDVSEGWLGYDWGEVRLLSLDADGDPTSRRISARIDLVDEDDGQREIEIRSWHLDGNRRVRIRLSSASGDELWVMGWFGGTDGRGFWEASGDERLDVLVERDPIGRRLERYLYSVGNHTRSLELGYDPASPQDVSEADREFRTLIPTGSVLNRSLEAERLIRILTDPRFFEWSMRGSGGPERAELPQVHGINFEFEEFCLLLEECRTRKCEAGSGNRICLICIGGDILCDLLRFFGMT